MAGSLNKVQLIGNLGRDPEVRTLQNGGKVASFSVATSESWKDKASGERQEKTQWHNIVVFNEGLAAVAERFLKKGSKIYVEGQLESRKWQDKDGADKVTTEIVLRPFNGALTMLEGKPGAPAGANDSAIPPGRPIDELEDDIALARGQSHPGPTGWTDYALSHCRAMGGTAARHDQHRARPNPDTLVSAPPPADGWEAPRAPAIFASYSQRV